eukprot:PhM_4_TR12162/c0_g1_i1/m.38199/K05643/ABCA3; ATP-binding cassette, subfamily A (ABC1), member 3
MTISLHLRQVRALLHKDFIAAKRNWGGTFSEIFVPIFICGLLTALLYLMNHMRSEHPHSDYISNSTIVCSPSVVYELVSNPKSPTLLSFERNMNKFCTQSHINWDIDIPHAINASNACSERSSTFSPTIMFENKDQLGVMKFAGDSNTGSNPYMLIWQYLFVLSPMPGASSSDDLEDMLRATDSYPRSNDKQLSAILVGNFILFCYLANVKITAGRILDEKINRVRELLRVMGMSNVGYIGSHYLSSEIRMFVTHLFIPTALFIIKTLTAGQAVAFVFISLLFTASTTSFGFLVSSVFNRAVWVNITTLVYMIASSQTAPALTLAPDVVQRLLCLSSPYAMFYSVVHLIMGDMFDSPVTFGFALGMLIFDCVLYLALALYIGVVFPGPYGVPRSPLFFVHDFMAWKNRTHSGHSIDETTSINSADVYDADDEKTSPPHMDVTTSISFRGLSKFYGSSDVPAVNKLDMDVRRGEIFALLGHNGAGKTTTMNMIIGLIPATSYARATVGGYDLNTEMKQIRRSLGMCPQFDVLFDHLTGREHLRLFAQLRGHTYDEMSPHITELLEYLALPDDDFTTAKMYSGGMKRRLSVANSLIGGNNLIVLDEPSSGLDPLSRRRLWMAIKRQKELGRTVLLSTHFMEEADYLGDRIGIMSKGAMYCCGTSHDLKQRFGCGFFLKMVKSDTRPPNTNAAFDLVRSVIPGATMSSESSGDVTMVLAADQLPKFEELLTTVDERASDLGFDGYGISMNTLEDVFVAISLKEGAMPVAEDKNVTETQGVKDGIAAGESGERQVLIRSSLDNDVAEAQHVPYAARTISQIKTLLWRRVYTFLRKKSLWAFYVLIPVCLIIVAFATVSSSSSSSDDDSYHFDWSTKSVDMSKVRLLYVDLAHTPESARLEREIKAAYKSIVPGGASIEMARVDSLDDYFDGAYLRFTSAFYSSEPTRIPGGFIINSLNASTLNTGASIMLQYDIRIDPLFRVVQGAALYMALSAMRGGATFDFTLNISHIPKFAPERTLEPTPTKASGDGNERSAFTLIPLMIMSLVGIALSMSMSAASVAEEFNTKIYHNLRVNGMLPLAYWVSTFLHDFFWCMFPCIAMIIGIYAADVTAMQDSSTMTAFLLMFVLFAAHTSLNSMVIGVVMPNLRQTAYMAILDVWILAGILAPVVINLAADSIASKLDTSVPKSLTTFLSAATPARFYAGLFLFISDDNHSSSEMWSLDSYGSGFLIVTLELILPIAYLYLKSADRDMFRSRATWRRDEEVDADVAREVARVQDPSNNDAIRALNIVKVYPGGKQAVRNVTLGVKHGECFGLLGPNGAGKTTMIGHLLGQTAPNEGTILLNSAAMCHGDARHVNKNDVYNNALLGVCQQHDALWDFLTGRQHMELYLRMRLTTKYDEARHMEHVTRALESVQLLDDSMKVVSGFSGGMKRKLSVALAMFTGARIVFLDEPSTGMDPFARRALWKAIHSALGTQRAVILTTHSMEEAESVCGRIAIMTDGTMKCVGNAQHLKNRFGGGYMITLTVSDPPEGVVVTPEMQRQQETYVDQRVTALFSGSSLLEALESQRKYAVATVPSLARAFGDLSRLQSEGLISTYSVSQTSSLEQIFLQFAGANLYQAP